MKDIKTIIIDCDGVLTDGKVYYSETGQRQKAFHSRDITAIKRLINAGYEVIVLTRSTWDGLSHFARRFTNRCFTGVKDKAKWVKTNLKPDIKFIAVCDDYDDIPFAKLATVVILPKDCAPGLMQAMESEGINVGDSEIVGGGGIMCDVEIGIKEGIDYANEILSKTI